MTKLVLVLTGVGQAAQSLIIGLGLIRRGSFTRAVLTDDDLMAGFSCARMLDSLLRLTGAHNVYYVKYGGFALKFMSPSLSGTYR